MEGEFKSFDLSKLNKEQEEAVKFGNGPLLIVAGAGTGKTTVITTRILYLLAKEKISPENILALTFTDKAAEEMENRVIDSAEIGFSDFWISTFHSFCERILQEHGLDIGLPNDFTLLDETQAWLLVRENLDKFNLRYYQPLGNPIKFIRALINHFSRCKDEGIYPEDYLKYSDELKLNIDGVAVGSKAIKGKDKKGLAEQQEEADRIKEIAEAYATYQKLLLDNNFLDFGDLINYTLKLFKERPSILKKYQNQFKYVLVDEFQDTNWTQYELVKLLALPENNLTVCADDDQSIYMWRGSSFNNVLRFRKDYPQSKEIVLIKNYRSPQNILDLSYKFIQLNNPNRLEYQLSQVKEISEKAQEKGIDLENFKKIDKKLIAQKKEEGKIEILHFKTAEQEAKGVAEKILSILKENQEANFNDFAILVRANKQAQLFCRALERAELPYQFLASKGLYSQNIILDIISYFRVLLNYYDSASFFRIINFPFLKIPYEDIVEITQYGRQKGQSIYETLQRPYFLKKLKKESIDKINFVISLIKKHSEMSRNRNVNEVFISFLKDSGYLNYIVRETQDEKSLSYINQFYNKIKNFEASQVDASLKNFMSKIDLELESGEEGSLNFDLDEGPETIKVMTVHSAKGLEFDYVFIVNLVEKRFPSVEKRDPIEIPERLAKEIVPEGDVHLQEERRLFYVAMTRARKALFFTWADDYGGKRTKRPSRFLVEAGLEKEEITRLSKENEEEEKELMKEKGNLFFSQKIKHRLPPYFSYTQLIAYQKCPLQYKFAHILKIPISGSPVKNFGKSMHKTLYDFLSSVVRNKKVSQETLFGEKLPKEGGADGNNNIISFEELLEIYKKNWIDDWFQNKEEKDKYFEQGKKSLKIFYQKFIKEQPKVKIIGGNPALEKDFSLKLDKYLVIGKIDRIDETSSGGIEIIDYKTGSPKKKLEKENKQQLILYQIAAEEIFNLKPEKLTFYFLEDGSSLSFLATKKEKEKLKEEIVETIRKIEKQNFSPTPGWQCQYCDFKDICDFRSR